MRALGLVHIDLQAADATGSGPRRMLRQSRSRRGRRRKVMHVTTSGLVYLTNLGVAATNDPIEFQAGAMTGHATGADYSSDSGMLTLHSAVSMSGMSAGRPVTVTAATAEFDERNQQAFLTRAKYDSAGRTVEAEQATLQRRPDGTLARVEAQGNVTIRAQGATTVSQHADVALNGTSQPRSAVLTGGVMYSLDEPLRQARGQADEATIAFDAQAKPQPEHAVFTGAVHMIERTRATEAAREPWSMRDLTAAKVEVELARAGEGKVQPRDAEATGDAHLTVIDNGSLAGGSGHGTEGAVCRRSEGPPAGHGKREAAAAAGYACGPGPYGAAAGERGRGGADQHGRHAGCEVPAGSRADTAGLRPGLVQAGAARRIWERRRWRARCSRDT